MIKRHAAAGLDGARHHRGHPVARDHESPIERAVARRQSAVPGQERVELPARGLEGGRITGAGVHAEQLSALLIKGEMTACQQIDARDDGRELAGEKGATRPVHRGPGPVSRELVNERGSGSPNLGQRRLLRSRAIEPDGGARVEVQRISVALPEREYDPDVGVELPIQRDAKREIPRVAAAGCECERADRRADCDA